LTRRTHENEIGVDDFTVSKRYFSGGLDKFVGVGDETEINALSHVFHGLAKRGVGLQFGQVRLEVGPGRLPLLGAKIYPEFNHGLWVNEIMRRILSSLSPWSRKTVNYDSSTRISVYS